MCADLYARLMNIQTKLIKYQSVTCKRYRYLAGYRFFLFAKSVAQAVTFVT